MRLHEVRITDHRSVWGTLEMTLGSAITAIVGPNLAGKSNLLYAVAAALDPTVPFDLDRERPASRPASVPAVTCVWTDRERGRTRRVEHTVSWPGRRVEESRPRDAPPAGGRPVVAWSTDTPDTVLRRVRDALAHESAAALATDLLPTLRRVLPDVHDLTIDLEHAAVTVRDTSGFPVAAPTARAAFAAALAAHFVRDGADLTGVLIEEPEAFLHPAAQEALRDELVEVGVAADTPVLITTESPFVVPRTPEARVIAVARDAGGRTSAVGGARGDEPQAALLGGLFRDGAMASVLDRTARIPAGVAGVVIVEGGTDVAYLTLAAERLGRAGVLDRLVVQAAGGALPAALEAIVLRAETATPLYVLLDNDDPGRRAKDTLVDRFRFANRKQVTTYAEVVPDHPLGAEAEDLFDWRLVARFVAERGEQSIRGKRLLRADEWHFDLTGTAKSAFVGWLDRHAETSHLARWSQLLDLLEERLLDG